MNNLIAKTIGQIRPDDKNRENISSGFIADINEEQEHADDLASLLDTTATK